MSKAHDPQPPEGALTIAELAAETKMSVRNLREWQGHGLVPSPEIRGRVGYYPPAVVERVRRIQSLRAEGFTLELIARMLDAGGEAGDDVMRLAETLRAPLRAEARPIDEIHASLRELGFSDEQLRASTAEIRRHAEGIAAIFESVWLEHIWEPFVEAGMPDEELPRIQAAAARVQPLAVDAVVAVFTEAMEVQITKGIAREVGRASGGNRLPEV